MNKLNLLKRYLEIYSVKNLPIVCCQSFQVRLKSDKKDIEKDSEKDTTKNNNSEALKKLNLLLKQMVENDTVSNTGSNLQLARPKMKRSVKHDSTPQNMETSTVEKNVISSVKEVAKSLGGDIRQTESELLQKLLNPMSTNTTDKHAISTNLSDIVKTMKIDRSKKSVESASKAQQLKSILQTSKVSRSSDVSETKLLKRQPRNEKHTIIREKEVVNLFGKETLGIFSDISQYADGEINKTWQKLYNREMKLVITHPPANYFQEMILWTEQGKLWKFPIDNEQGMEEEQNIYFTEHVFLEKHLEPWCPPKGPIRHFMELVCIGLSKNPYMSVKHKQEHITWFRDYFQDKQRLLEETGAIPQDFKLNKSIINDDQN